MARRKAPSRKPSTRPTPTARGARAAKSRPAHRRPPAAPSPVVPANVDQSGASWRTDVTLRELFWTNIVREMLTNLSMLALQARDAEQRKRPGAPLHHMLDGRIAVITRRGRRLGIADVMPLFACGVPTSDQSRAISMAVECSVFRIVTPEGEVWTLPLSEIRAVHSLSEELISQLQEEITSTEASPKPFGFAAFTSLARPRPRARKRSLRAKTPTDDGESPI